VLAGLIGSCANVGFMSTGLVAQVLNPNQHWRLILVLCVLPALLTIFFRMFVPESTKWERAAASGPRPRVTDIFQPPFRRRSLLGAAAGAVALLASWGGLQMVQGWVGKTHPDLVPTVHVALSLGQVVGSFGGAVLGALVHRRLGYGALCVVSLGLCESLFVGFADGPFDGRFLGMLFVTGVFTAAFYGWLPLYLPELFPTRVRAAGQGFCFNFGRSLAAVGVLLMTFAIDLKGNFAQASALICLVYLAGIVLAWFLPETRGQPLPE
jgi:MFS family permease